MSRTRWPARAGALARLAAAGPAVLALAMAAGSRGGGAQAQIAQDATPAARAFLAYLPGALPPPTAQPQPTHPATATATATATPSVASPTATATDTASPTAATPSTPGVPACARTTGDAGGLRISLDGGRTVLPGARSLPPIAYTWALLVHPGAPGEVLELHERRVYRSLDAGCTLARVEGAPDGPWTALDRAPSDPRVWVLTSWFEPRIAYTMDDGATWEADGLPEEAMHLAIDPDEPLRWSFVGRSPVRYERASPSVRWVANPIPAAEGETVTAAAHADGPGGTAWLVGTSTDGLLRSADGVGWLPANEGLLGTVGAPPEEVTAVVPAWLTLAPSDPNVGYAVVNRVARGASERGIFRTTDGGATWVRAVVDDQDVGGVPARITGGTRVWVDPLDPRRALFAFGSYIEGYGVDLFRSSDGLDTLEASHLGGFYKVYAVAFGPPGSDVLLVGASSDVPAAGASR